ncbi:unnamed protein product [Gordionus sp. m RMFG-2023]
MYEPLNIFSHFSILFLILFNSVSTNYNVSSPQKISNETDIKMDIFLDNLETIDDAEPNSESTSLNLTASSKNETETYSDIFDIFLHPYVKTFALNEKVADSSKLLLTIKSQEKREKEKRFLSTSELRIILNKAIKKVEKLQNHDLKFILPLNFENENLNRNITNTMLQSLIVKFGFVSAMASEMIKEKLGNSFNKTELIGYLKNVDFSGTPLQGKCPYDYFTKIKHCESTEIYRQIDGYCNNLKNPLMGTASSPVQRFIDSDFGDGINDLRRSKDNEELPNPRIVSTTILHTETVNHNDLTHLMMVFGQFMDHEFALGSSPTGFDLGDIKCCDKERQRAKSRKEQHFQCMPIYIPEDDYFYSKYNSTCMELVRSTPAISTKCHLGPRQTNNEITSFIDGSPVYGSNADIQKYLREFQGGRMKTQQNPLNLKLKPLLPISPKATSEACANIVGRYKCFGAGDKRTNENSLLMSVHTIFMREHNRIAESLENMNPHWNDEKIYQEARKIVGALIQHITYNEFLPIVIGQKNVNKNNLTLKSEGYSHDYDENLDATVDQGFITAAFRFGHSLINKDMFKMKKLQLSYTILKLKNDFFHPQHIYRVKQNFPQHGFHQSLILDGGIDQLVRGLIHQPAQIMDNNIADDVKNHLFRLDHEKFGMDLMVLNIIRAREHGVPGYNAWRKWCGLLKFETWDQMKPYFMNDVVRNMEKVYKHPDDIDLFPAGISENSDNGALLGPTFSCILSRQFNKFKHGDRFWYENANQPGLINHAFKFDQLKQIRKATLSRLICDNSDTINVIQANPFKQSNHNNSIIRCKDIPQVDLNFWKDT